MHFTKFLLAASALALASAQTVMFTNSNFGSIKVGTPFNITWAGATSGITIKLKTGPANAQTYVKDIVNSYTGSSYLWTPDPSIVDGTYNLEIDHLSDAPNYSVQFQITGGAASSTSVSSSASSTITSASSSSSSPATTTGSTNSSSSASKTSASSTSKSTTSSTSSSSSVPTSNDAAQYASHFALVLMAGVAIIALN